ncbi:MAG: phosphatidate cytidylyltransferase [Tissierellia bacterium]|nr:phosphatidate cytidylyltransferase [Tissierellia bacterium]
MGLIQRAIGGGFILTLLLLLTYLGHNALSIGVIIFSSIALYEIRRCFKKLKYDFSYTLALFYNLLIMIAAYLNSDSLYVFVIIFTIVSALIYMLFNKKYRLSDLSVMLFSLTYISVLMSHMIRFSDQNFHWILYIIAWGSDTFAYLVGSTIGSHKIKSISHISPNKTIEGSIGGVVGTVILVLIYNSFIPINTNTLVLILSTIICSILSQIGDLVASYIKRYAGIKDYGNIIRGHGGILDRFDSMLFISPIIYYITLI